MGFWLGLLTGRVLREALDEQDKLRLRRRIAVGAAKASATDDDPLAGIAAMGSRLGGAVRRLPAPSEVPHEIDGRPASVELPIGGDRAA